jgi:DNA-binding NarL/FixJ family response regulator
MEQPAVTWTAATARATIGDDAYASAWADGRAMPIDRIIALALELVHELRQSALDSAAGHTRSTRSAPEHGPGRDAALTAREREVAALIGQGYSNRRIAERLVIAEKTAEVHARNIREKLGLDSRAQIAAWAAQHGLLGPSDA